MDPNNIFNKESLGFKISVVVLTYNHVNLIRSTIESILSQTIHNYELIISDDYSNDGTWQLIQELSIEYPNIVTIRTPYNMGMAGNANFAVEKSSRQYVALLHHDDIYRSDLLEKWCSLLELYPTVGFVFNKYGIYQSSQQSETTISTPTIDGKQFLFNRLLSGWGCPVRGTAMIRRSSWDIVGGLREQFGLLADVDLWMRLSRRFDVGYIPETIIFIRQERPSDYDPNYLYQLWSWKRKRILSEIHIINHREIIKENSSIRAKFGWWIFKFKLNFEIFKWIGYAVVRRKTNMISSLIESHTTCDMWWLKAFRTLVYRSYLIFFSSK